MAFREEATDRMAIGETASHRVAEGWEERKAPSRQRESVEGRLHFRR
uniref:Uncharacterized protein n=1 Tax=Tetraselmis sp. GSL018 TaxID=582737 RepID=A0A061S0S0_9CHLO